MLRVENTILTKSVGSLCSPIKFGQSWDKMEEGCVASHKVDFQCKMRIDEHSELHAAGLDMVIRRI